MRSHQVIVRAWVPVVLALSSLLTAEAQDTPKAPASLSQIQTAIKHDPGNPKLHVALGLAYWDQNDYPHALEAFQRAVKVGPASAEAHNWLGVAILEKADLPGAIAEFRKAVSLDTKYARAYTNLGSALAKGGELAEAVDAFQKALALEPDDLAAHMNLGVALREKGDAEGALIHLRRVAASEPSNAAVQYELGQTLRQNGDLTGAVEAFERALQIDPELREGYYGLGVALKQQSALVRKPREPPASPADALYKHGQEAAAQGELNAAREQLLEALRVDESRAQAHNLLGFILGQQGDLASALVHLERSAALRPESAETHYNLGVALWYSGSKDKAISELRESVRLDPAAGASHAFLGTALRETGELTAARVNLQCAIALLPPIAATYIDLGIVYLRANDLDKALGQLETGLNAASSLPTPDWDAAIVGLREALAKNPGSAEAHNVLGLLLGRKGADSKEVVAEFREAVRLRPGFAEAHNNIGLVLAQADDDEAAMAAFREAIRIRPDYADAHANLGATLTSTDAEQAISELEKSVTLAPGSVKAQFNLAVAYAASPSHGPTKEIDQLRKVIAIDPAFERAHLALGKALLGIRYSPQSAEMHYNLGKLFSMQDNWGPARKEFEEALRLDPSYVEDLDALGLALEALGDDAGAVASYQKAIALNESRNGTFALAHVNLSAYYNRTGDPEKALEYARKAVELDPKSDRAWFQEARAEERQGRLNDTVESLNRAISFNPRASSYYYVLSGVYRRLGKKEESRKALEVFTQLDRETNELEKKRRSTGKPAASPPRPGGERE
jgi:tetratricopeptide (TPR) repeat protein